MRKFFTFVFFLSVAITQTLAQNPFCEWDGKSNIGNRNVNQNLILNNEEGCSFRFILKDPGGFGWWPDQGIQITVDGVDYGLVTLPMPNIFIEVIKLLPSGEIQFFWIGNFNYASNCFEIYNSSDSLIYQLDMMPPDTYPLFFIYQNECPECIPLTGFNGEYISETNQVNLSWTAPENIYLQGFDIFRNDELIDQLEPTILTYVDNTANLGTGKYKYCVVPVYPFLCSFEEENCFETNIGVGINNYSSTLFIYPNPTKGKLQVTTNKGINPLVVEVYDIYGRKQKAESRKQKAEREIEIDISALQAGIYFVKIYTESEVVTKKVIKN